MKTLKWFSLESYFDEDGDVCVDIKIQRIRTQSKYIDTMTVWFGNTTQEAFTWLENNGYIEKI